MGTGRGGWAYVRWAPCLSQCTDVLFKHNLRGTSQVSSPLLHMPRSSFCFVTAQSTGCPPLSREDLGRVALLSHGPSGLPPSTRKCHRYYGLGDCGWNLFPVGYAPGSGLTFLFYSCHQAHTATHHWCAYSQLAGGDTDVWVTPLPRITALGSRGIGIWSQLAPAPPSLAFLLHGSLLGLGAHVSVGRLD